MKNSEWGFVGDERLYLSYSFPVLRGETMEGLCPLHPQQGHCPCTQYRILQYVSCKHCSDAAKEHAHTLSQGMIETLRAGCGTAAPRAGRCGTPPAGCFASGENMKKDRRESKLSRPTFFYVFMAPVGSLSVLQATCGKKFGRIVFYVAERVQGRWPCCGVQGLHKPPLRHFLESKRKERGEPLSVIVNQQF